MLLEVCANSFQSALNADKAGAQRIELCENLEVGGLTPNTALIQKVLDQTTLQVFVLIRPRAGDFVYTDEEYDQMKSQIEMAKTLGCHGIVAGVLNHDRTLDYERTAALIRLARPLTFTFHRAFDELEDPLLGLQQLIELGVDRILTSGQAQSALEGIELLTELMLEARSDLIILPGAGVHPENALAFKKVGFPELHASARTRGDGDLASEHSDQTIIEDLIRIIQ